MAKYRRRKHRAGCRLPEPSTLKRSVADATYPVTWEVTSTQTALGALFRHQQRREAAEAYAKRYLAEHGQLPTGTHQVALADGANGQEVAITFPRKARPR